MEIDGRVGYQCSNFWRELIKNGKVRDFNYKVSKEGNGKVNISMIKKPKNWKKRVKDNFLRYGFVVKKDLPGPFRVNERHYKCPKNIKKLLRDLGINDTDIGNVYDGNGIKNDSDNDCDNDKQNNK